MSFALGDRTKHHHLLHCVWNRFRELNTARVGQLTSFTSIVTRTSDVRPELLFGTFECRECGSIARNISQQFRYTQVMLCYQQSHKQCLCISLQPQICSNKGCQNNRSWNLNVGKSKLVDSQQARAQEYHKDVPSGSMPRFIDVIMRHDVVDRCKPGDRVKFTGTLIVIPCVNKHIGRSCVRGTVQAHMDATAMGARTISYRLAFVANSVILDGKEVIDLPLWW